jgi:mRNA-degrading endonuclease RelE of RelBE toxin-antitoxin system
MSKAPRTVVIAPHFARDLRRLEKKYRHVGDDSVEIVDRLAVGETPGDQVPGTGYTVFKVRLASSDMQRGKSGGFRVIYYLQLADRVVLLTIYAKARQENIDPQVIAAIIREYETETDDPSGGLL